MDKAQIAEVVELFTFDTPDIQKSAVNRLESALTKTGSALSRLTMASASLNALASKYDLDDESSDLASLNAMSQFLKLASLIAVDNKKTTEPKTKRENWHDADSTEAKTILASKSPRKPRKSQSVDSANSDALIQLIENLPTNVLLEAMAKARASK